jgi:hypothetical protein
MDQILEMCIDLCTSLLGLGGEGAAEGAGLGGIMDSLTGLLQGLGG